MTLQEDVEELYDNGQADLVQQEIVDLDAQEEESDDLEELEDLSAHFELLNEQINQLDQRSDSRRREAYRQANRAQQD